MAPKADETKTSSSSSKGEKAPHYQLSSSDRPGDQLVPHVLKGTNYSTWRRAMTNALTSKHKMVYMNGKLPKPKAGDPNEEDWTTCNSMVIIVYHDTAEGMWKELEERFSQGSGPRIQEIKRELANLRQGDMIISSYYVKMKNLWEQLNGFSKPHTNGCTCGVAVKEKEEEKLHQLLTGLNDAYGVVRSNLLCKDPLPSLSNAYSFLTSEEVTIGKPFMESVAFKVNTDGHKGRDQNKKLRCEHCKKTGHIKDNCFEIIGYPPNWQGKKKGKFAAHATILGTEEKEASKGQTSQLSQEQIDQLMALLAREKHFGPAINFIGKDLTTKRVIAAGELKGNLYYLDQGTKSQVIAVNSRKKGYKVLDLQTKKFLESTDVVFYENSFPFQIEKFEEGDNKESPLGILPQNEIQVDEDLNDKGVEEEEQDVERIINDDEVEGTNVEQQEQVNNEMQNNDQRVPRLRRSPTYLQDYVLHYSNKEDFPLKQTTLAIMPQAQTYQVQGGSLDREHQFILQALFSIAQQLEGGY
ncbi:Zinc finger, CCHC-type superfamily [Sesbania bispinosa]|nr:Zinc finger, CCHC-type superfamily [Sesbania bispinosa]